MVSCGEQGVKINLTKQKGKQMIDVKFCRAPSHNWVGWCWYQNGLYCSAGKTLDDLLHRVKNHLYACKRVSAKQIYLASRQSDPSDAPLERMTSMFKTKFWYDKDACYDKIMAEREIPEPQPQPVEPKGNQYDFYTTKVVDGVMVVYGVKTQEVARYPLQANTGVQDGGQGC